MASRGSKGSGGSSRKKGVRFVKGEATRKTRPQKKTARSASSSRSAKSRDVKSTGSKTRSVVKPSSKKGIDHTPSWKDLVTDNDRKKSAQQEKDSYLGAMSTTRFAVAVLSVATLFTLYVGHILTTQDLLSDVQELRLENETLELQLNQYQGQEDEMVGYAQISERARELGLVDRVPEGNPIIIR